MRRPRLFWRIYATYLGLAILSAASVGLLAGTSARSFYLDHTEKELKARAALVREEVAPLIDGSPQRLEAVVRSLAAASGTRLTVISAGIPGAPVGQVLAESDRPPNELENHRDRPEFKTAASGGTGQSVRYSDTLGEDMMYVAIPLRRAGTVEVVVRAAMPLTAISEALTTLDWRIVLVAAGVALVAALLGLLVTSRISRQMSEVEGGRPAVRGG